MKVLTIDPSMTNAGYALPDGSTTHLATASNPDAQGMADHRHRLSRERAVRDRLLHLAGTHGADLIVIEGYAPNQQTNAVYSGELGGILRDSVDAAGYAWVVVPPNLRAKMATGKGNASKDMVLQAVSARTGKVFASSDECDAWLLWQMAQHAYGLPEAIGFPQAHLDALTGVDWPTFDAWDETPWAPLTTYKPPPKKKRK